MILYFLVPINELLQVEKKLWQFFQILLFHGKQQQRTGLKQNEGEFKKWQNFHFYQN